MQVRIIQTGGEVLKTTKESIPEIIIKKLYPGTIDKLYPRTSGGYAFEIGDSAAAMVMRRALGRTAPEIK